MKELHVLREELEGMNEETAIQYVIGKLMDAGFDLSNDNQVIDSNTNIDIGYVKYTQKEL